MGLDQHEHSPEDASWSLQQRLNHLVGPHGLPVVVVYDLDLTRLVKLHNVLHPSRLPEDSSVAARLKRLETDHLARLEKLEERVHHLEDSTLTPTHEDAPIPTPPGADHLDHAEANWPFKNLLAHLRSTHKLPLPPDLVTYSYVPRGLLDQLHRSVHSRVGAGMLRRTLKLLLEATQEEETAHDLN